MGSLLSKVIIFAMTTVFGQILLSLGIGLFSYTALTTVVTPLLDSVVSNLQGLPADILSIFSLMGLSKAFSIIFSAILTRVAMQSARVFVGKR